jgi:transcription elongation factor SPT5
MLRDSSFTLIDNSVGPKGQVLHIHQSCFTFLHNQDIIKNGGMFVTRAQSLVSLAQKGNLVKTGGSE